MKASLALAIVLLLGLGCDRNRASTCVAGASSPCTCSTGASGAQTCQDDGTFAACQCVAPPVVAPVAPPVVAPPVVAPVAAAPTPAMPHAPHAPTAPHAPAAPGAPTLTLPNLALPGVVMPGTAPANNAAQAPNNNAPDNAPNAQQLGQIGQLISQGLNPQQIQSITNAITTANRGATPDHPTFSPAELTQLSQMATQQNAGPSALQSAAQSMLGGS